MRVIICLIYCATISPIHHVSCRRRLVERQGFVKTQTRYLSNCSQNADRAKQKAYDLGLGLGLRLRLMVRFRGLRLGLGLGLELGAYGSVSGLGLLLGLRV